MRASALGTGCGHLGRNHGLPALVAVVGRNPVSPPQLAADAPVADIVRPVEIDLLQTFGNQFHLTVFHRFHRGLDEFFHLYEPLLLYQRFHGCLAAVMGAYIVGIFLDLHQESLPRKLLHNGLSGRIPVHSAVRAAVLVDGGVVVHHIDHRQAVTFSHFKVVGVMGGGNLHHAGAEFPVHVSIRHHRNHPVHDGQHHALPDQVAVPLILGMYGNRGITQHGFRTGGGKGQKLRGAGRAVIIHHRIPDMPEMPGLLLVFHLRVGDGGIAHRAPVNHPGTFINIALLMHLHEDFRNRPVAALVHGKALPVPVAGRTQLLQLGNDAAAVFLLPVPCTLQKFLTPQVMLVDALFFQRLDNLYFRCNGCVVRTGLPQRIVALHPLETDQNVLHGIVKGMAHVQLPCDIGRRNHDGERGFTVIHLRVEIFLLHPFLIQSVFQTPGFVGLCQFLFHLCSFPVPYRFRIPHALFRQTPSRELSAGPCAFTGHALLAGPCSLKNPFPVPFSPVKKTLCRLSSAKGVINAVPPLFTADSGRACCLQRLLLKSYPVTGIIRETLSVPAFMPAAIPLLPVYKP